MSSQSPAVVLYDLNGNAIAVQNGVAIPASTPAIILAGSDGTNSRYITVDSSGRAVVVGAGVSGTPAGGVVTIQGVAGGTTVPVSGTVTSNIGTTNGLALDTSVNGLLVSQGSTTSGEKGTLIQGAVTTAAPTYTTAQTSPLSLTTAGALRIDGSGVTQPVSGTITANAGSGNFTVIGTGTDNTANSTTKLPVLAALANTSAPTWTNGNMVPLSVDTAGNLRITGSISASNPSVSTTGTAPPGSATYIGGSVTTAAPSYTTGQMSALSLNLSGGLRVDGSGVTQPVSGTVTANAGSGTFTVSGTVTSNIGTTNGLALDTSVNGILVSQGSTTSGEKGTLIQGAVTTAAPTYTTAQTSPLSLTTAGALRIDGSGATQPVSGTVAVSSVAGTVTVSGAVTTNKATTSAVTTVAGATANTAILASNANRVSAAIYNNTTKNMYVLLNSGVASTSNFSIILLTNAYWEIPNNYTGAIQAVWASGVSGSCLITEMTP